jgi:hypothetical protein
MHDGHDEIREISDCLQATRLDEGATSVKMKRVDVDAERG